MDTMTLFIAYTVVTFSVFVMCIILSFYLKSKKLRRFSYAFLALVIGPSFISFTGLFRNSIFPVIGHTTVITGYLLLFSGIRSYFQDKNLWPWSFWGYLSVDLVCSIFLTYITPNFMIRNILLSMVITILLIQLYLYLRKRFSIITPVCKHVLVTVIISTISVFCIKTVLTIISESSPRIELLNDLVAGSSYFGLMVISMMWFVAIMTFENSIHVDEITKKKEQVSLAIKGSNDGIWDWNILTNETYYSPRWKDQLGYEDDEIANKYISFENLIHPADYERVKDTFNRYFDKKLEVFDVEFRMHHKDGSYRWIEARGEALWDENGRAYRMAGSNTDITNRKESEQALKISEEKFRLIAENILDVIIVYNVTLHKTIYVTPSITQLTGYTPEEYMQLEEEDKMTPESIQKVREIVDSSLGRFIQNADIHQTFYYEVQHICKDGRLIWAEYSVNYAYNDKNEIVAHQVTRNIEERKKAEEKILYLSYHDVLTGLYNRRYFDEAIKRLDKEDQLPVSVIMGDLNLLKLINDAFGHEKGDELLIKAAETMKACCRSEDIIIRLGGDEFIVLLPKTPFADAKNIIRNIQNECKKHKINSVDVSISLGASVRTSLNQTIFDVMKEAENEMYKTKAQRSDRTRSNIMNIIADTFFEKYPEEEQHALRVSKLCGKTATALEMEEDFIIKAELVGKIHDIGKVSIDVRILDKKGPLDNEEWEKVKQHSEIGFKIVGSAKDIADVGQAILMHHERIDGLGYPRGIKADKISRLAKILAIAESYDAMTTAHPYRNPLTKEEAILEIKKNEGSQFDRPTAETFIEKVLWERM
ncbi:MAG: diguanylate cyclase [Mobilitalea sp.]